jgi:hypothetical protein
MRTLPLGATEQPIGSKAETIAINGKVYAILENLEAAE